MYIFLRHSVLIFGTYEEHRNEDVIEFKHTPGEEEENNSRQCTHAKLSQLRDSSSSSTS